MLSSMIRNKNLHLTHNMSLNSVYLKSCSWGARSESWGARLSAMDYKTFPEGFFAVIIIILMLIYAF